MLEIVYTNKMKRDVKLMKKRAVSLVGHAEYRHRWNAPLENAAHCTMARGDVLLNVPSRTPGAGIWS